MVVLWKQHLPYGGYFAMMNCHDLGAWPITRRAVAGTVEDERRADCSSHKACCEEFITSRSCRVLRAALPVALTSPSLAATNQRRTILESDN